MAAAGVTQSTSPRLPSPPPFTEDQIGPKSPSVGESFGNDAEHLLGTSPGSDDASTRRIRPGTKSVDMAAGPPLIPLSQLDSPFQLQEHLKALYNHYTRPEGSDTVVPISRDVAIDLAEPPEGVDRSLWLYELCRFLTMKVNNLIIAFFAEDPPCSAQTCPEMRASEWQYLCAVHDPPKSCCAIDYCCHTLDWATNILTSPKHFPSRLTLGSESAGGPQASMRHLTNIFRRLYRIFAHAWFQHREVFWQVEGHDGLYIFFKTVCDLYHLIPEDNYTVPAEAEGIDAQSPPTDAADGRRMTILRKENEAPFAPSIDSLEPASVAGATTRRHKNSPSMSSRPVTTISEGAEDDESSAKTQPEATAAESIARETESQTPVPGTNGESQSETEETTVDSTGSQITVAEVQDEEDVPTTTIPAAVEEPEEKPVPQEPEDTSTPAEDTKPEVSEKDSEKDNAKESEPTPETPAEESAVKAEPEPESEPKPEPETKEPMTEEEPKLEPPKET